MGIAGKNFIGNRPSANGANYYSSYNPVTGKEIPHTFYEATLEEINQAVQKAVTAFKAYSRMPSTARADFLEAIGREIFSLDQELINVCMEETGLPEGRLLGERGRTINQLNLFANLIREGSWIEARIDTGDPERKPVAKPDIRQMQIPLGPVGIFGASNFPLAFSVAGGDTASALAAGCPIVVKAHPLHPGTSELVAQAVIKAAQTTGMPDGVFSLLHGKSNDVGMGIVRHEGIKAIGFTGSFRGGKAIYDAANRRDVPIPVFAEMGSVNPVFILPRAAKIRADEISSGLTGSLTLGVGQFCTNPGLIVSGASNDEDDVITMLGEKVQQSEPGIMLAEGIRDNYEKGISRLESHHNLRRLAQSNNKSSGFNSVRSQLFRVETDVFLADKTLSEEVFGPSAINISTHDKSEMIEVAERLEGHLTATIIGEEDELEEYRELIDVLQGKVGRLIFNGYPTGVEVCHAMVHGGPFPATTCSQSTSVGTKAIMRFTRPVCFQDCPDEFLPVELRNRNSLGVMRLVNGDWSNNSI